MKYILSLDEGTTNVKAFIFNEEGKIIAGTTYEFSQYYPKSGWVEHNPEEIWKIQIKAAKEVIKKSKINIKLISAIGITNQRETTIIWDKHGKPIYNAIVWQCKRTTEVMENIKKEYSKIIREKTGLVSDAYFSASKIKWILDNVPDARKKAKNGELMFGTVDSYLIYKLTGFHVTDYSNASRTLLFNIRKGMWDPELLEIFDIPEEILPEVLNSADLYGYTKEFGGSIPITGVLGDQQAALFGQTCFNKGMMKVTYGTGNFLLANIGESIHISPNLLTTIAWKIDKEITYALEGSIFTTGAALKWLKEIGLINSYNETEKLASSVSNNNGVFFVPAFSGLGAPYWDQDARGLLIGITRGTKKEHIVRSVLESIGYLTRDVVEEIKNILSIKEIRVDGGASKNEFIMQFQSDILGIPIVRPVNKETTSLGAALIAGLEIGLWQTLQEISEIWKNEKTFYPKLSQEERERLYSIWKNAVSRALRWNKQQNTI